MPRRYLLWDHDGVLVDTERLYFEATRRVLGQLGADLDQDTYLAYMAEGRSCWDLARSKGIAEERVAEHRAHRREQVEAVASATLLVEALRRSGHDVTRRKLVAALEGVYGFRTGLIPAVTFDRNRRVGVAGAYVVRLDAASGATVSRRWIALD